MTPEQRVRQFASDYRAASLLLKAAGQAPLALTDKALTRIWSDYARKYPDCREHRDEFFAVVKGGEA